MGHLRIKVKECSYKQCNGQVNKQFIDGVNDDMMTTDQPHYKQTSSQLGKEN